MAGSWETLTVDASAMRCYTTLPGGQSSGPGIVVCMHAPGVDAFIQGMADRLAQAGFAAIAPDLYHRQTEPEENPLARMAKLRDDQIVPDLAAATVYLRGHDRVSPERTGVIGFCMGGRLAYLHAATDASLGASVVFYGGNILVPWGDGPPPFERSESINCPVLGLFGADDGNPSPEDVAKIDAELTRLGVVHEFKSYPGAGHAFLNDARPSYRAEAASDAWERCVDWLHKHLG